MHNIQVTIDKLRDQLSLSENNLKHLQDTQLMLEKEIHMKNVSKGHRGLGICAERCVSWS